MESQHQARIVFCFPNVVGGVSNVAMNISRHVKEGFDIKLVAYSETNSKRIPIPESEGNSVIQTFSFSANDNLYTSTKRFSHFIGNSYDVLVVTDSFELKMVELQRIRKKIIFYVLGDFQHYYHLALHHQSVIDCFVAISTDIASKLKQLLPARQQDIFLVYFPVPAIAARTGHEYGQTLRLLFVGRLETGKNPLLLTDIEKQLQDIPVSWTIVGNGPLLEEMQKKASHRFTFKGTLSGSQLQELYGGHDVLVMPSLYEGLPVSVIEAMKWGLVPVVSNIEGGMRDIVEQEKTGLLCTSGDATAFAAAICQLHQNRTLLQELSANAVSKSDTMFDPVNNSRSFLSLITAFDADLSRKQFGFRPGNRLDRSYIPNFLVRLLRSFKTSNPARYDIFKKR